MFLIGKYRSPTSCLFILIFLVAGFEKSEQKDYLKITVYYESYCPDSINFMMHQLVPMMGEFNRYPDWLILDLVPFGKANETSHYKFTCQHGPKECEGNKMHACAIDKLVTRQQKPLYMRLANFIYCLMNEDDQIKASRKCAARTGVNYKPILKCYKSKEGDKLLEMYGNRTAALVPKLSWVPTIVINDKFNQTESDMAQKDLYGLVCDLLPDQCK